MSVYQNGTNWQDRILNHYPPASDGERYYKISGPDGDVIAEAAKLELLNTVLPGNEGTPVNATNLNTILAAMGETKWQYTADKTQAPYPESMIAYLDFSNSYTPLVGSFAPTQTGCSIVEGPTAETKAVKGTTVSSGVDLNAKVIPLGKKTIRFRLKWNGKACTLVDETGGSAANFGTRITISVAGIITWTQYNGGSALFSVSTERILVNKWKDILCVWDGTTASNTVACFIDGELQAQATAAALPAELAVATNNTVLLNNAPLATGGDAGSTSSITDFELYSEALYANTYTLAQTGYSLFDGATVRIRFHSINTGANSLLNINETGNVPIDVSSITTDRWYTLTYFAADKCYKENTQAADIRTVKLYGEVLAHRGQIVSAGSNGAFVGFAGTGKTSSISNNRHVPNATYDSFSRYFKDLDVYVFGTLSTATSSFAAGNTYAISLYVAKINTDLSVSYKSYTINTGFVYHDQNIGNGLSTPFASGDNTRLQLFDTGNTLLFAVSGLEPVQRSSSWYKLTEMYEVVVSADLSATVTSGASALGQLFLRGSDKHTALLPLDAEFTRFTATYSSNVYDRKLKQVSGERLTGSVPDFDGVPAPVDCAPLDADTLAFRIGQYNNNYRLYTVQKKGTQYIFEDAYINAYARIPGQPLCGISFDYYSTSSTTAVLLKKREKSAPNSFMTNEYEVSCIIGAALYDRGILQQTCIDAPNILCGPLEDNNNNYINVIDEHLRVHRLNIAGQYNYCKAVFNGLLISVDLVANAAHHVRVSGATLNNAICLGDAAPGGQVQVLFKGSVALDTRPLSPVLDISETKPGTYEVR